jgi:teichuronic acid biosynthesis glycosyltransferase TuaG
MKPKISIVIPCYNGSEYIIETLNSILSQSESRFEIIIIDDGSTDDSKELITRIADSRVNYIYQHNKGVSSARNNGFLHAIGDYIVFFDGDDIMSDDFLSSRLSYLEKNLDVDFAGGPVIKFTNKEVLEGSYNGVGRKPSEEILLYDRSVITCPSNYMFRKKFLDKHSLKFSIKLSSTADRYFLVECSKYGNSNNLLFAKPLMYRISEKSMSHFLTENLVADNEKFYDQLLENNLIPENLRKQSLYLGYFMLFGAYWKVGLKYYALKFAYKSFVLSPSYFFRQCVKRI